MLPRFANDGQCLYHQPCGVVGVFNGQLLLGGALWEECCQVDGFYARLMLGIGNGLGDMFAVRQDGQIVLFTIRETIASGSHLADEQRNVERCT